MTRTAFNSISKCKEMMAIEPLDSCSYAPTPTASNEDLRKSLGESVVRSISSYSETPFAGIGCSLDPVVSSIDIDVRGVKRIWEAADSTINADSLHWRCLGFQGAGCGVSMRTIWRKSRYSEFNGPIKSPEASQLERRQKVRYPS